VGGIKEKVLAAKRAGIRAVILPKKNEKDLEEIPEPIKKKMEFHFVQTMDEIIPLALREKTPKALPPKKRSPRSVSGKRA
jgi:ATP-dependent Lon protease